jgi:hypothetical protein
LIVHPGREVRSQYKEAEAMTKEDKVVTIFGIGLNAVVATIVLFASTNIIA